MGPVVLLAACLGLGALVGRWGRPPEGMVPALNWWVLNLALPALTLARIPQLHLARELWFLIAPQWLGLGLAAAVFAPLGQRLGWSRPRTGTVILMAGLANTSFLGFPLLEALRGEPGLVLGTVADQLGSFCALAIGGAVVTAAYTGHSARPAAILRKVLTFPPFIAVCVGLVAGAGGGWPVAVTDTLLRIGATLSPLALFSVGLRLRLRVARADVGPLVVTLSWRLLAMPLVAYGLGVACGVSGIVLVVGVLQAGMAPMISAAIIAEREGLDSPLATSILAIGILGSLATVPLADWLLRL